MGASLTGIAAFAAFLILLVRKGPLPALIILGVVAVLILVLTVVTTAIKMAKGESKNATGPRTKD